MFIRVEDNPPEERVLLYTHPRGHIFIIGKFLKVYAQMTEG